MLGKEDEHWWKGRIGSNEGIFPAAYVKQLS